MAIRDAVGMLIRILGAVQACHDAGLIHRDIKPSNILLDQQNEPHVTDFGLARFETGNEITVTHSGRIIGTLAYMSLSRRGEICQKLMRERISILLVLFCMKC